MTADDHALERLVDRRQGVRRELGAEAAALACTCSGREAPTIAEATSLRRSTHASARWASDRPARSATGRSR